MLRRCIPRSRCNRWWSCSSAARTALIPACAGKDAQVKSLKAAEGILDAGELGIFDLSQPRRANQPHQYNQQSAEEAALRSDGSAGQPSRAGRARTQKMTGQRLTAVGDTIKIRFAPVERQVESDRHPEIAGSAQQKQASNPNAPALNNPIQSSPEFPW
jgi:hypothetical protein